MRGYTRHQLKQDRFAEAAQETVSWAVEHRNKLVTAGVVAGAAILLILAVWYWVGYRDQQAAAQLARALRTYQAPLRPANMPPDPAIPSFTSAAERARAASGEFRKIADSYGSTQSGKMARYFLGLTDRDLADTANAETELKKVADSGNKDLASLAKLALAGVYRDSGRDKEAVDLYNDLISHPTDSVAKSTAQLELAALYEPKQPLEARRLYEQIRKEEPAGAAAEIAGSRLGTIK